MSIPILDNTVFTKNEYLPSIVKIPGMTMTFIIQCCIGAFVYWKIRRSESPIRRELVSLFCISFILTLLSTTGYISANAISLWKGIFLWKSQQRQHTAMPIAFCIGFFCYYINYLILLLTLVTRLHVTFQGSVLEMSKCAVYSFAVMFIVAFILMISGCVGFIFFLYDQEGIGRSIFLFTLLPGVLLYVTGCIMAVGLFVLKLSAIAKMQRDSQRDLSQSAKDFHLNDKQQKLLNLSAKYILLFFVAILSTFLIFFLFSVISTALAGLFVCIDACVHLHCLCLQFAFAAKHYRACCGCLDSCCRTVVLGRAKRKMHLDSMSVQMQQASTPTVKEQGFARKDMSSTIEE